MTGRWFDFCVTGPLCAGLLLCAGGGAADAAGIEPDALDGLPHANVVILGEIHDNPVHHGNQARALRAMSPAAIVFEMFGPEAAARITPDMRSDPGALALALDWDDSGWPEFGLYAPLFEAAPAAAIYGGAMPLADVRRAISEGAAKVMGADALALGLKTALDPEELSRRVALQGAAHCDAMPADLLPGMVEAQRLRDAGLARAIITALKDTGGPVAVITGNGHARTDWGVPRMVGRVQLGVSVLSVGQFEEPPIGEVPYDLWLVTDPVEREDPCAAFR